MRINSNDEAQHNSRLLASIRGFSLSLKPQEPSPFPGSRENQSTRQRLYMFVTSKLPLPESLKLPANFPPPKAQLFDNVADLSPSPGGEGRVRTSETTNFSYLVAFRTGRARTADGARTCDSLNIVSRMICSSRRGGEFQNRSVLMPRDCRNASRLVSCCR